MRSKYAPSKHLSLSGKVPSHDDSIIIATKSNLQAYKGLLKTAVGSTLVEILAKYNSKGTAYTLNISHLDLDKSPVIEEKDESNSPAKDPLEYNKSMIILLNHYRQSKGKESPSFASLCSENKGNCTLTIVKISLDEIKEIVQDSVTNGGLDGNKLLLNVQEYISKRIMPGKSEKKFIVFLGNYVKAVEKKLQNLDYNFDLSPQFDEDEDLSEGQSCSFFSSKLEFI